MRNNTEAQKFILIQLQTYNKLLEAANESNQKPQTAKEILLTKRNSNENDVAAQLSVAATFNEEQKSGEETKEMITREHHQTNVSADEANQILELEELTLAGLSSGKIEKSKTIIKLLQNSTTVTIDKHTGKIQSKTEGPASDSNLFELLINIQHPTKKNSPADLTLIKELKIAQHLVANTNAKSVSPKLAKDSNTTWLSMFSYR